MTLREKLLLAQLPLAVSLLILGVLSRRVVSSLEFNSQEILQDNYLSVLAAQRMRDSADAMARAALHRAAGVPSAEHTSVSSLSTVFERELKFQEGNITEHGERETTEQLRAAWTRFQRAESELKAPGQNSVSAYFTSVEPALVALEALTAEVVTINQDAMLRKSDRARHRSETISSVMLAATIAVFAFGFLTSIYFTNRVTRPLAVLAQAVRRVGQGDLEARARLPGKDEVAQVATEFNVMAQRLSEYRSSSLGEMLQTQHSSQAAIDSLPDPVLVFQLDGGLLSANQAAASLFGVDTDAPGAAALARVPPEVRDIVEKMRQHVRAGKGSYVPKGLEEAVAVRFREGPQYFLARTNTVEGEEGKLVGFTLLFQDVTRLRRFDELKTDMVATVAHEFRTPLTSLRMAIHLCLEEAVGTLEPKQAELLYVARDDCERLQTIVDDVLDLSRIQSGHIELHKRSVSSGTLLAQAVDDHRALARDKGVTIRVSPMTINRSVVADVERIRLVFANLLSNAIRHTPSGGTVEVRGAPEPGAVRFEVSDTGVGIPANYLPRVFERFFRAPGAPEGGAGLGLFICKEIVEAHEGRIGIESEVGHGTIVWFTLPATDTPAGDS